MRARQHARPSRRAGPVPMLWGGRESASNGGVALLLMAAWRGGDRITTGVCFTTLGFSRSWCNDICWITMMILTHEHTIYTPSSYDTQGFPKTLKTILLPGKFIRHINLLILYRHAAAPGMCPLCHTLLCPFIPPPAGHAHRHRTPRNRSRPNADCICRNRNAVMTSAG